MGLVAAGVAYDMYSGLSFRGAPRTSKTLHPRRENRCSCDSALSSGRFPVAVSSPKELQHSCALPFKTASICEHLRAFCTAYFRTPQHVRGEVHVEHY